MHHSKRLAKGFTLVEIMIVVVIIGLLATMAIPAFTKIRKTSQNKTVLNNLRQIAAASQQYMLEQGVTQLSFVDIVGTGTDKFVHNISTVGGEDYAAAFPQITSAMTEYKIDVPALGVQVVIYSQ